MTIGGALLMATLGGSPVSLPPCPDKPNCVSTQATDTRHAIKPIAFTGSEQDAMNRLLAVLKEMPRTRIVTQDARSVRVEFTTRIFRWVDDGLFIIDGKAKVIHFRSASRVGHSDLGENRRRMEGIREAFGK